MQQPSAHDQPASAAAVGGHRADVAEVWDYCLQWAHQPREGVILPMHAAVPVAREAMNAAIRELSPHAPQIEISAFLQRRARDLALQAVAAGRELRGDPCLWHDPQCRPEEPVMDLLRLRNNDNAAWLAAVPFVRQLAMPVIRSIGVGVADAEDVLAEVLAALVLPDKNAKRPLDDIWVAEQLPGLCKVIARYRALDFLRRSSASKRNVSLEVGLDSPEAAALSAPAAGMLTELDLRDILEHSPRAVSPPQWEAISRLIIHPSDTHSSLIADTRLMKSLSINPQSSEATRRRRLHEVIADALSQIRHYLDLP